MSVYLSPGVYIEEIPSGSKPIEAVSTSTAAFVGAARKGPAGDATLIHSLDEYKSTYGEIVSEGDSMGLAVQAFYMNGGKDAYICRLVSDDSPTAEASDSFVGQDVGSANVLTVKATSVGEWGNELYVRIVKPDANALTFTLEVGHQKDGAFEVDETFSDLSMDEQDSNYALTQVNGNSQHVKLSLEDLSSHYQDATLTGGQIADGFSASISTTPWVMTLNINGLGAKQISLSSATLTGLDGTNATDGPIVAAAITAAVMNLGTDNAYQSFVCSYAAGRFSMVADKDYAPNASSASVEVYDSSSATSLASLLKFDSDAKATVTGGTIDATVNNYFSTAITGSTTIQLNIDGYGAQTVTLTASTLGLTGLSHQTDGEAVAKAIQTGVRAISSKIASYKDFTCAYKIASNLGTFTFTSGSGSSRTSSIVIVGGTVATTLGFSPVPVPGSPGRQYDDGAAKVVPKESLGTLDAGVQLSGGGEAKASASDFNSFFQNVLRKVRDVSIILLPGQTWAQDGSGNVYISEALAHCEALKNRMVIIDPPKGVELEQSAQVDQMGLPTSTYSVLYYPWIKIANPLYDADTNPNVDTVLNIAPSACAAGMWAKIDGTRGVWKAPAGVETQLLGIAGLQYTVEEGEQDQLNPLGVNCIRKLPSFGSVIWGSRTLSTKAKPEWRYVPVRRTAIFIERSIYDGIQWAVFEPNDHPLWSSLRANIESFMNGLFRAGAFQGKKASDAFFVRCGLGDTMTQGDIDRGQVIVMVGFAPLKPAEFVIVRIQQKVGQQ